MKKMLPDQIAVTLDEEREWLDNSDGSTLLEIELKSSTACLWRSDHNDTQEVRWVVDVVPHDNDAPVEEHIRLFFSSYGSALKRFMDEIAKTEHDPEYFE